MDDQHDQAFIITRELAQALVDYLQARPYGEVHGLVDALLRIEPAPARDAASPAERSAEDNHG